MAHRDSILKARKQYREANPEVIQRWDRNKYLKHRTKILRRRKSYYQQNRESIVKSRRDKYWKNVNESRRKSRQRMKLYRKTRNHKLTVQKWRKTPNGRRMMRKHWLKNKYGITLEQYEHIYKSQKGRCAICRSKRRKKTRGTKEQFLQVDHCHKTKIVRGLLCYRCNVGLGSFGDSVKHLRNAANYVEKQKGINVKPLQIVFRSKYERPLQRCLR